MRSSFLYNNINFYTVSNYLSFNYRLVLHLNYYIHGYLFTLVLIEFLYFF